MVSFLSTYMITWEIYLASWCKDWESQQKSMAKLEGYFVKSTIPVTANLVWNVLTHTMLEALLLTTAGFSTEFQQFSIVTVLVPQLVGSLAYYCYKYGAHEMLNTLTWTSLVQWIHNWIALQGLALVAITHTAMIYCIGVILQRYLLPTTSKWNTSVRFSTDLYEDNLRLSVYWFAGFFVVLCLTLPLWKRGYETSMQAAGRNTVTISYIETFMELMYQTSQANSVLFVVTPMMLLLQNHGCMRIYTIHIALAMLETIFINYAVQYKYCIVHQVLHEIKAVYAMTHIEHHVCKGIHPTTSAFGLWETWISGLGIGFVSCIGITCIPYAILQIIYMGANLVVHTMWPSKSLLQWHTLHHTVLADVYNVNIPSPYDLEHSKSVAQLNEKLKKVSPFVRYEILSDMVSLILGALFAVVAHYGFGVGAGHADWANGTEWQYY